MPREGRGIQHPQNISDYRIARRSLASGRFARTRWRTMAAWINETPSPPSSVAAALRSRVPMGASDVYAITRLRGT